MMKLWEIIESKLFGGPGSGNFGHKGRPGKRGGSIPGGKGGVAGGAKSEEKWYEKGDGVFVGWDPSTWKGRGARWSYSQEIRGMPTTITAKKVSDGFVVGETIQSGDRRSPEHQKWFAKEAEAKARIEETLSGKKFSLESPPTGWDGGPIATRYRPVGLGRFERSVVIRKSGNGFDVTMEERGSSGRLASRKSITASVAGSAFMFGDDFIAKD